MCCFHHTSYFVLNKWLCLPWDICLSLNNSDSDNMFNSDLFNYFIRSQVNMFSSASAIMFTSASVNMFTSGLSNMFTSDLTNMFTSASANMFTSDLVNIFHRDLANKFTSDLEKCKNDSANMFPSEVDWWKCWPCTRNTTHDSTKKKHSSFSYLHSLPESISVTPYNHFYNSFLRQTQNPRWYLRGSFL